SRAAGSGAAAGAVAAEAMPAQDRDTPVTSRRAVVAKRLAESKFSAPHYYLKSSINMSEVIRARNTLNKTVPEKVSFNAFLMKFAAEAIKRHPVINSSWQGDSIREYASIDIGLAVDVGAGLITPIVRNCGAKGVKEIDAELVQLIDKARSNALKPEEYTGATFSISNLGSFGVDEFTAIINPPGSAILAVGRTKKTPVVDERNDGIMVQPIMTVTLSCDHRVIDGAAGGRFLHELSLMMQEPFRVLF
ncbi:MAG: 2-oxo acid dehydrogenase subunit E2, partial [Spirochaetia bacterium]